MGGEEREVEISVRTIGPGRPARMRIASPIRVCELRRSVAAEGRLPVEQLKLILRGQTLRDRGIGGDEVTVSLKDGDSLIVAVVPKPPAKHLREDFDDDDELKFQIPESENWWKKKLFTFLREKLRLPDILLLAIFSISLKTWAVIVLWFALAPVAHRWDVGPIYILGTGFAIVLTNLGKRQDGDASAYSIFNEDFRELPGTLNAGRLDRDIRAGQF
uniref:SAYSvFN domain-containing protein 1 n=1 Tax=Anthurium amnicola TaxID=1678845 RepID=A0A1D1YJK6_9ARAE